MTHEGYLEIQFVTKASLLPEHESRVNKKIVIDSMEFVI